MKLVYSLLVVAVILCISCQRSQFATTTRVIKNGRTTYSKNYLHERRKLARNISERNETEKITPQSRDYKAVETITTSEIITITSVSGIHPENLVASATREPIQTRPHLVRTVYTHPDTIVKENQSQAEQKTTGPDDTRKVEKLGLAGFILSIPGLVPIVCLPLAILGLIFGIISLRKIKRNPTLYKGKGFAIAGIILGVLGILGILLFIG